MSNLISQANLLIGPIKKIYSCNPNNNKAITGTKMNNIIELSNAYIAVKDDIIIDIGLYSDIENLEEIKTIERIDAHNLIATPGFIDPHTHLVFAGNRAHEFSQRCLGKSYKEIANSGGGILHTTTQTNKASLEDLINLGLERLSIMLDYGITTCEVKTGYGLNKECELKMLEAILKLNQMQPIDLIPTFMPAHAIPKDLTQAQYTKIINDEMLEPAISLIKKDYDVNKPFFCDVFCDEGYFDLDNTIQILEHYKKFGFNSKVHANEFANLGIVTKASSLELTSCDHMLNTNQNDINALKESETIAILLPGTSFFLGLNNHANARLFIDNDIPIAIGSDYNPGSCHIMSSILIFGLSCINLKMTPTEVLTAMTFNAACALKVNKNLGILAKGYKADINLIKLNSLDEIPYNLSINPVYSVIKNGKIQKKL